jgi:hypothetical protein
VGIHKEYSHEKKDLNGKQTSEKSITRKMRGHEKRSGVNWHVALMQKGVKQGLGVL